MAEAARSIFLSYASEDAGAASRLGDGLRAAGLEVWFDQSELRGGDAWDQLIRRRIRECALFMPVISAHTQQRLEGYFRLEWRLAVERTHLMADGKAFLVPVVIDAVGEPEAQVPESFRAVQWTRLPGGVPSPAFIAHVQQLLQSPALASPVRPLPESLRAAAGPAHHRPRRRGLAAALGALAAIGLVSAGWWFTHRPQEAVPPAPVPPAPAPTTAVPGASEAHSVAVLPFRNMSGDAKDDYFSDGLSEELLNSLAAVPGLQVAARTSSFSFKGRDVPIAEIARQLNVATVLDGSVRRERSRVRIATELIDARSGFQRWSQTYDRDLKDVLSLQSEIAAAVAAALKVELLKGSAHEVEAGGTSNPRAFDAYLRAEHDTRVPLTPATYPAAVKAYDEVLALDPNYANAYIGRARVYTEYSFNGPVTPQESKRLSDLALADLRRAAELAPALGDAHSGIGYVLSGRGELAAAAAEYDRGYALSPGSVLTSLISVDFLSAIGRFDEAAARAMRATQLDPLNAGAYRTLGFAQYWSRRYPEALNAFQHSLALDPGRARTLGWIGLTHYAMGNYPAAVAACEVKDMEWVNQVCLALAQQKLGKKEAAQAAFARLKKEYGDSCSYQHAQVYAQWGQVPEALAALERAHAISDPGMLDMKVDPLLDPLRHEPRFQALLAQMNFPD
jgi:TolB-like protein/Tfp pilus assembly protein PilF